MTEDQKRDEFTIEERVLDEKTRQIVEFGRKMFISKYMTLTDEGCEASNSESEENSFDNLLDLARSPPAKNAPVDVKKLQSIEWELSTQSSSNSIRLVRLFFMLHCVICVKQIATFHYKILKYGGWFFLFPYTVCLVLFAFPMAYVELALGQYTSQTPAFIFARLAPITQGIAYSMFLLRAVLMNSTKSDHRIVALLTDLITSFFVRRHVLPCENIWSKGCRMAAKCDDVFFQGQCHNLTLLHQNFVLGTSTSLFINTRQFLFKHTLNNEPLITPIVALENITKFALGSYRLFSILFMFTVFLLCTKVGMHRLSKVSVVIVLAFYSTLIVLFAAILIDNQLPYAQHFVTYLKLIPNDIGKLVEFDTWFYAMESAYMTLSIGDGALHTLGSLNSFSDDFFSDLKLVTPITYVTLIFGSLIFGTISTIGVQLQFKYQRSFATMEPELIRTAILKSSFGDDVDYNALHHFTWGGRWRAGIVFALYATLFLMQIAWNACLADGVANMLCSICPSLQRVNRRVMRHFAISAYFFLMIAVYVATMDEYDAVILYWCRFTVFTIVLWQCLAVAHLYKAQRLITNLLTMCNASSPPDTKRFNFIQRFSLYMLFHLKWTLPGVTLLFVLGGLATLPLLADLSIRSTCITFIAFYPIIYFCRMIGASCVSDSSIRAVSLARATSLWGPQAIQDRRAANFDERAARIIL